MRTFGDHVMNILKRILAFFGAAFGLLALFHIFFSAWSLTLKNFGLSVEAQLIAQRIITPLLFVALGALAVSCEYFRRVLLRSGIKAGILVRVLRVVALVVLPVVIVLCTLNTPFWSYPSPMGWDRPRFIYGWPLPWKGEPGMTGLHKICPFLNLFLWTLYLMVLVGYRRIKHYLILLLVMLVLFVPYAKFVGIKPVYRGRGQQSKVQSSTAAMLHLPLQLQLVSGRIPTAAERVASAVRDVQGIQNSRADVMHPYIQASLRHRRVVGQEGLVIGFNATSERNRT